MAQEIIQDSQLRLVFELGLDQDGIMKYKNKNYNNIKTTSTPDQLHAVAQAISGLQSLRLYNVERNDSNILTV